MEQHARTGSALTKIILRAITAFFVIGLVLIAALLLCFLADIIGVRRDVVSGIFPSIVVLIVYVGAIMVALRLSLAWSLRRDRR